MASLNKNEALSLHDAVTIFSKGKNLPSVPSNESPLFVLLVGSPGVGKTTLAEKVYIQHHLHMNPEDFFNVSLDSLVEPLEVYRNATRTLHQAIVKEKVNRGLNMNLSPENAANLSNLYLPAIMSKNLKKGVTNATQKQLAKIRSRYQCNPLPSSVNNKTMKRKFNQANNHRKCLNELLADSIHYGIQHRYHMIYDTTLNGTEYKLMNNVMRFLEKEAKQGEAKYKVIVLIVTPRDFDEHYFTRKRNAPYNVSMQPKKELNRETMQKNRNNIMLRVKSRHRRMLNEGFIRAINPLMIEQFIMDNRDGFGKALDFFTKIKECNQTNYSKASLRNCPIEKKYDETDFEFHILTNPNLPNEPTLRTVYAPSSTSSSTASSSAASSSLSK